MRSREDEAYRVCRDRIVCRDLSNDDVIKDMAISLGRIADMLAEMNHYIVDHDDEVTEMRKRVLIENETEERREE